MSESTLMLGSVYQKLTDHGYAPCSALISADADRPYLYEVAEHPPAILTRPTRDDCGADYESRRVAVLVFAGTLDKAVRAKFDAIIEKTGLALAPVRVDSAGNEMRVLRVAQSAQIFDKVLNRTDRHGGPVVVLRASHKVGMSHISGAVVPLDGMWRGGRDLLQVPHAELPLLTDDAVKPLFEALDNALPTSPAPKIVIDRNRPQSMAELNRPSFIAPRSKREVAGQPATIDVIGREAFDALPNETPLPKAPISGGGVSQEYLDRVEAVRWQNYLAGQSH